MDNSKIRRANARAKRVQRVRNALRGTAERPRLSVSKTNMHLYAQLINDDKGVTLGGIGTQSKGQKGRKSKESARNVGKQIAELAKSFGISAVLFDRGRYKYHGIVAELATSAREAGLQF
ncbi:MAG TPA: 50S ribosomal protein L18 [Chlamydiales bacterium]|nr:50S ribosomal protein L18 [Chlamydiales bacterium]